MGNNFFKHGDKAYAENLNDGVLVGNAFDWTITVSLPSDTGGVFPNSSDVGKAKVCDVNITPNSNLSIGSTVSNSSGSNQIYRLSIYPNFNRFGGFQSISLLADSGVTFYIANKGGNSPIVDNLDYSDLSNVPELKVLKEYDIVITIPTGKEVEEINFTLQSSSNDVNATISKNNVEGLNTSLASKVNITDIQDNLTSTDVNKPLSANMGLALKNSLDLHNHDDRYYTETEIDNKLSWVPSTDVIITYNSVTYTGVIFEQLPIISLAHLTINQQINVGTGRTEILISFPTDYLPDTSITIPLGTGGFLFLEVPPKPETSSNTSTFHLYNSRSTSQNVTIVCDTLWKY